VARGISRIIFKNPRGFLEICGLWVNFEQVHGLLCKVARFFVFLNYFPMGKVGGLGPWVGAPRGVVGQRFHCGLHSGRWQGLAGAWPNGRLPRGGNEKGAMRHDRGIAHRSLDSGEEVTHRWRGFGLKRLRCRLE
jgi:hypothetical protein